MTKMSLLAQSHPGPDDGPPGLGLSAELFRPLVRTGDGVRMGRNTGGAILVVTRSVGGRSTLAAELPLAWGSQSYDLPQFRQESQFRGMGNPGFSLQRALGRRPDSGANSGATAMEAALRLPLAWSSGGSMDPLFVGVLGDPTRPDRWAHDLTAFSLGVIHGAPLGDPAELRVRGGSALWLLSGDQSDREFVAEYEAGVRTRGPGVRAGVGLRGIAALGSDYRSFSDRTIHRLHAEVGAPRGRWVVTGFTRVNLDTPVADMARFTVGVRVDEGRGHPQGSVQPVEGDRWGRE
ncbi:MAG: hypothetical protein EA421_16050 [Gemmatimonadales bacterium]|nr:MAG: hypothetical protein EA421_16050 [Gemmatimonadales bacterium]